jgi:cell division protein FtsQ
MGAAGATQAAQDRARAAAHLGAGLSGEGVVSDLKGSFRREPPLTARLRGPAGRAEPPLRATAPIPALEAPQAPGAAPDQVIVPRRPTLHRQEATLAERPPLPAAKAAPPAARQAEPTARPPSPRRAAAARLRDPAPSRLSYRMHRLWLTPIYRAFFKVGLPAFALALTVGLYLSDDGRRAALADKGAEIIRQIQERPEFMVNLMAVEGASPDLGDAVREVLPVHFPVSSFDLDLEAMRATVAELDAVADADLRIRAGGVLEVRISERVPAMLWRGPDGLILLDATGHPVAPIASRLERPDLAVIAGEGAAAAVAEARQLIEAAGPIAPRLRGLVRMGDRRWDVVLDRGQRILLPEVGAVAAFERVIALDEAEEMLDRDVTVIDMRYGARPTLRLSPDALEAMRGRSIQTGATNG